MNNFRTFLVITVLVCVVTEVPAQRSRKGSARRATATPPPTTQPAAQPTATSSSVARPATPVLLAIVNGQNITTAEIDPKAREEVETLDSRITEARRQILELQVNTLLLENEAAKRKLSSQQLYDIEVTRKLTEPTAAQIDKFIEENRDQINQTDPVAMRQQVVAYLKGEREARLSEELVKRLRSANVVVTGANINNPGLAPTILLATVAGRSITAGMIAERLKPVIYRLRLNTYLAAKQALDLTINDLLLLAEANRRNVPPEEIVRREISDKIHQPTDAEVEKFYAENKSRLSGDLMAVRNQIASYLEGQERERLEQALSASLRKGADIRLLISEPKTPVQIISVDDDPARGEANAAVTIVEFTDFQCPACAAMQPILDEVQKSYGNRVRLVVRDFPLNAHAFARKAAEAANAANAQGKFFEYTVLLFKRQNALDVPSLKKYASELGLDRARFDAALDSGKYAAEVKHDMEDGEMYGVVSTPTIFVNGMPLQILTAEALRAAIDQGLAGSNSAQKAPEK
jgi:protein-disulfide isomerase